jgi:hypothetical protein
MLCSLEKSVAYTTKGKGTKKMKTSSLSGNSHASETKQQKTHSNNDRTLRKKGEGVVPQVYQAEGSVLSCFLLLTNFIKKSSKTHKQSRAQFRVFPHLCFTLPFPAAP